MKKLSIALCAGLLVSWVPQALAQPAPRVFVAGSVVADVKRFSDDDSRMPLNGNAVGGESRIGTFLTPQWSLEFDFGISKTTIGVQSFVRAPVAGAGSTGNALIPVPVSSTVTNRPITGSAVIGYHPAPVGRVGLGYLGGFTFLHLTQRFESVPLPVLQGTVVSTSQPVGIGSMPQPVGSVAPVSTALYASLIRRQAANVPAAVFGIEARIALFDHWALVPDFRATAFGALRGGESGGFFFRPGIGMRWTR